MNKHQESNDILNDGKQSVTSDNFNEFQSIETIAAQPTYNIKKEDVISDSGNSTARDSKIVQSSIATHSFSATKSKMAEITQRFPLNRFTNETKLFKTKHIKENDVKENELMNNSNDEKHKLLDAVHIKLIIENHCDIIKSKLEDTIKINENKFR